MGWLYSNLPSTGQRGPIVNRKERGEWAFGSRQVRRRAMFQMYFHIFSKYGVPRRIRRLMASNKMKNIYKATAESMLAGQGNLELEKKPTWREKVAAFAKELFD